MSCCIVSVTTDSKSNTHDRHQTSELEVSCRIESVFTVDSLTRMTDIKQQLEVSCCIVSVTTDSLTRMAFINQQLEVSYCIVSVTTDSDEHGRRQIAELGSLLVSMSKGQQFFLLENQ